MTWGDIIVWPLGSTLGVFNFLVGLVVLAFIIWMIIDCVSRKFKVEAEKWIWVVVIFLTKGIGALVYFFAIRIYNKQGVAKK